MDDVDYASCMEADFTARAIEANRKSTAQNKLAPRGKCYNCDEDVEGDKLFCDPEEGETVSACHADWQIRIKRIRGHEVFSGAK